MPHTQNTALCTQLPEESSLDSDALRQISVLSRDIDISSAEAVLQYGSDIQQKTAELCQKALENTRNKDLGEVGDVLSRLFADVKKHENKDNVILTKNSKKVQKSISLLTSRYTKTQKSIDQISSALQKAHVALLQDIALMDVMYQNNQANLRQLTIYILAGNKKLQDVRQNILPACGQGSHSCSELTVFCERFEKRLFDLHLTYMICLQSAPQLMLVQNNATLMAQKIQSALTNTIPLWKSQMMITLGTEHAIQAAQTSDLLTDMTNTLLQKNAERLKSASILVHRENQRGIVDITALQNTNRMLIETFDEIALVQQQSRESRQQAQTELIRLEKELKCARL